MADSLAAPLAGLALAAGEGRRLRPLTLLRPKPLCPVGDRTLLDWSLDALEAAVDAVAVNVHHGRDPIVAHLGARAATSTRQVHLSIEEPEALGTAGAVGRLRDWLDGRGVLVVNADTWHRADLARFAAGWDGERVRILTDSALPFGPRSGVVASILPWSVARELDEVPSGLWECVWGDELAAGRLDAVHESGPVVDCGRPTDYLRANLEWSGGESVLGAGAQVEGTVVRSVVWPGAHVAAGEVLVDAIRADGRTVLVR
jgi:N-acetyl-alpha-D-muramate 1-phosphate uridylyltransferase